jgi:hypothetical protein
LFALTAKKGSAAATSSEKQDKQTSYIALVDIPTPKSRAAPSIPKYIQPLRVAFLAVQGRCLIRMPDEPPHTLMAF